MNTKYILVTWSDGSQNLMEHPRFNECLFVMDIEGHEPIAGDSAYMCPEDLYNEIFNTKL